ncbi:fibronectin type III domain-containing protein [Actinoplanes bogorensis]|uniref:Fibronectin type III domain-containing protein n=1 Tax=Paractinoplanes bogorensis TaxID=1610840 RepID=A0ABS5YZ98_9ACTN|nr:fibronectin type III domain-containing protein [Actinoplanes bogorensis]MBU2668769.1 fibronectin type III domain-containing protein [Actinoplanes bogorensis]
MFRKTSQAAAAGLVGLALLAVPAPAAAVVVGTYDATVLAGDGVAGPPVDHSLTKVGNPYNIAFDPSGDMYFTDSYDCGVVKLTTGGDLTVIGGENGCGNATPGTTMQVGDPRAIARHNGDTYIGDALDDQIVKIDSHGALSIVSGPNNYQPLTSGPLSSTGIQYPSSFEVVGDTLYLVAYRQAAKVDLNTMQLTLIAGNGTNSAGVAGPATQSPMGILSGIAVATDGTVYLSDQNFARIYRVTPGGTLSTVTTGSNWPTSLAMSPAGDLFAGLGNSTVVRVDTTATNGADAWTPMAGSGSSGPPVTGPALNTPMFYPRGLAFSPAGDLHVAAYLDPAIVKLTLSSAPVAPQPPTLPVAQAGNASATVSWTAPTNNGGSAVTSYTAQAYQAGVAVAGKTCTATAPTVTCTIAGLTNGTAYTYRVTATNSAGTSGASADSPAVTPVAPPSSTMDLTIVAGNGGTAIPVDHDRTKIGTPWGLTFDPSGDMYIADSSYCRIMRMTTSADLTVVAGSGGCNMATPGTPTRVGFPYAIARHNGDTFIGDRLSNAIQKIDSQGVLSTVSGSLPFSTLTNGPLFAATVNYPSSFVVVGDTLYLTSAQQAAKVNLNTMQLTLIAGTGFDGTAAVGGPATASPMGYLGGIAVATDGTVYLGDQWHNQIYRVAPNGTLSIVTTAAAAVTSLALSPAGVLYAALSNYRVVRVDTTATNGTNAYTTVAGTGAVGVAVNGPGLSSPIYRSIAMAFSPAGDLHVAVANAPTVVKLTPSSAPVAPQPPTLPVALVGDESAVVSWTAPLVNGGSPVTSYTAQAYQAGVAVPGKSCTTATLTCTVQGLTNGVSYTYRVTATNSAGTSSASAGSPAVTAFGPPDPPALGAASTTAPGSATLAWTAPADNGGTPVTSYTVQAYQGGVAVAGKSCTTATLSCTVSGLMNGTTYTLRVSATTAFTTGAETADSATVTPIGPPNAPAIASVVNGSGQATVTWTAPVGTGGSAVTSYTVQAYQAGVAVTGRTCTTATLSCTVPGLTNGVTYTYRVAAANIAGAGAESVDSAAVQALGPPDAPTAGLASSSASGDATLAWTAPVNDGGTAVVAYTVQAYQAGVAVTGKTCATATLACTVSGLTNGTAYTLRVSATTAFTTGAESADSAPVTPVGPPGAPTIASVLGGSGQATLTWTAPVFTGGAPITSYLVQAYQGGVAVTGKTCTTATLTCTVSGLTNGTAYTLRVTAGNGTTTGPASADSTSVTPLAPVVPVIPAVIAAPGTPTVRAGTSSITVSWPASTSSTVTGYTAVAAPGGNSCTSATTTCVIGAEAGKSYTVTVTAQGTGVSSAPSAASESVTPTAPVAPTTVPVSAPQTLTTDKGRLSLALPSQQITVIGTGFAPNSTTQVVLYSTPTVLGTTTTDGTGSFALPVTVPASLAAGDHTFLAQGVDTDGSARQMSLPVTVPPTSTGTSGNGGENQNTTLPVPSGGRITLLDANGDAVRLVTIPGQGTYALDSATGRITFAPIRGFTGRATAVRYRITDSVGTVVTGTYTAVVASAVRLSVPTRLVTTVDGTALVRVAPAGRHTVTLWSTVGGKRVSFGRATATGTVVPVPLNALARRMAARPGGYVVTVTTGRAGITSRLVLQHFELTRSVYFAPDSAAVSRDQASYLAGLRSQLAGVRAITCTGWTDNTGTDAWARKLAARRAQEVCRTLTAGLGIRGILVSRGKATTGNDSATGKAHNRRTEIMLHY